MPHFAESQFAENPCNLLIFLKRKCRCRQTKLTDNFTVVHIGHQLVLSGTWWKWRDKAWSPSDLDVNVTFPFGPAPTSRASTNGGLRLPEEVLLSSSARLRPDCRVTTPEPQRFGRADAGTAAALPAGWPPRLPTAAGRGVLLPAGGLCQCRSEAVDTAGHHVLRVRPDWEGLGPDSIRRLC